MNTAFFRRHPYRIMEFLDGGEVAYFSNMPVAEWTAKYRRWRAIYEWIGYWKLKQYDGVDV